MKRSGLKVAGVVALGVWVVLGVFFIFGVDASADLRYISENKLLGSVRPVRFRLDPSKTGFHREFDFELQFDLNSIKKALPLNSEISCRVAFTLNISSNFYLDRYQLQDLRKKEHRAFKPITNPTDVINISPEVIVLDNINLEQPSFFVNDSASAVVVHDFIISPLLLSQPQRLEPSLKVPLHIRYHMPQEGHDRYEFVSLHPLTSGFVSCVSLSRSNNEGRHDLLRSDVGLPQSICEHIKEKDEAGKIPFDEANLARALCKQTPPPEVWCKLPKFEHENIEFSVPVGDLIIRESISEGTVLCYAVAALLLTSFILKDYFNLQPAYQRGPSKPHDK